MATITYRQGMITDFAGGGILVPCDIELTYKKANIIAQNVILKAGADLLDELVAIGYCEIGNAVITKGYGLEADNLIFLPYTDHNDNANRINNPLLHQALRSALSLALLYGLETLAIPIIHPLHYKKNLVERVVSSLSDFRLNPLFTGEFIDVVEGIIKDDKNTSLKEVFIYK